ncbi:hypothetical protein LCGC14_0740400 [marine sediment metagenome]|uniref:Uncharacterized protein n=1 Tax=marine sediment metagenome TaxID=412755 RepID=A0A0F9SRQ8_9ZZZZ
MGDWANDAESIAEEAASDILERETIIAKLAAEATAQEWYGFFPNEATARANYERGYRDALSRLWNSTANVEDIIRTLARL